MIDYELQHAPWRYVNIKNGEKTPVGYGWQKHPLLITEIYTENVGVILGGHSNGLCAIDFDGIEAIDHFNNIFPNIDITSYNTAMWTSGKPYRFQVGFYVPEMYWTTLKRKVINSLEFRWNNTQSILPPSKLVDGREYVWIKKPSNGMCTIPDEILAYWLSLILDEYNYEPVQLYEPTSTSGEEAARIAEQLKKHYPQLDYDTWIRVTWGFCNSIGYNDGIAIMKYYYPEQKPGEYKKLLSSRYSGKVCTIGTIIKMIKDKGGIVPVALSQEVAIRKLRKKIKVD